MNTSKDNLEFQIKKRINEREITPSRDLWSEIELQNANNSHAKSRLNWYLIAACLVLTVSLGAVLFFNKENSETEKSEIIAEVKTTTIQNKTEKEPTIKSPEISEQKQKESVAIENISKENKEESLKSQIVIEPRGLPLTKENAPEIIANISKIEPEKIIAKSDSAKTQVKKKRYVDPSTLLFSVEHKDAIQKSKSTSNVASIEIIGN